MEKLNLEKRAKTVLISTDMKKTSKVYTYTETIDSAKKILLF